MITVIIWSDGSQNKFHKGDKSIVDFVQWKKQRNPNNRIVLRFSVDKKILETH